MIGIDNECVSSLYRVLRSHLNNGTNCQPASTEGGMGPYELDTIDNMTHTKLRFI